MDMKSRRYWDDKMRMTMPASMDRRNYETNLSRKTGATAGKSLPIPNLKVAKNGCWTPMH
jgi:hypothetical protein